MKKMFKKAVSVLLCLVTLITVVPFSALFKSAQAATVDFNDPLIARVAEYCSPLTVDIITSRLNSGVWDLNNVDDYNEFVAMYNELCETHKERWDLLWLTNNEVYTAWQFKEYISQWHVRSVLGLGGLVFNSEAIGYITGEWAEKEKYKVALEKYMKANCDDVVETAFITGTLSFLGEIAKSIADPIEKAHIKNLIQSVGKSTTSKHVKTLLYEFRFDGDVYLKETVHLNNNRLASAFGITGDTIEIVGITANGISNLMDVSSNLEVYKKFGDFLDEIANDYNLPVALRCAANELSQSLAEQYLQAITEIGADIMQFAAGKCVSLAVENFGSTALSATLSSVLLGISIGKFIGNVFFGVDELIKASAYVECYAILAEKYQNKVLQDKERFISTPNNDNAVKFIDDYKTLQKLRLIGEQTYIDMQGGKGTEAANRVLRDMTGYADKKEFCDSNIEKTTSCEFSFIEGLVGEPLPIRISYTETVVVACPVDVNVYDSDNNLVAKVTDNVIDETVTDSSEYPVIVYVDDDVKTIRMTDSDKYRIEIKAFDSGEMTYSAYTYSEDYELVNMAEYSPIEITSGDEFEVNPQTVEDASYQNLYTSSLEEIKPEKTYQKENLPETKDDIADVVVSEELFEGFSTGLIDKVANAMFSFESVVDITSYNISTDDTVALFSAISKYYPTEYSLLTKGDFEYKIIFSPSLGCITDIRFYYGDDANLEAFEQRNKDLKAEIDKIVAQVEGMDDFEKALYIHDYIVLNSEYDLELLEMLESGGTLSGELYTEKYSEYSILINGTGICGSYALAYRALMNAAGVDCLYLSSQQMNHAWNMVKIDGEWYHVDCCWDDPVPDTYGDARRTYFLRTDEEIMELNHYSWVPGTYKSTSTLFSNMPRYYNSKQKYDDGYWYVLNYSKVYKTDLYGNNKEDLFVTYSSSIDVDNGDIYYSAGTGVYYYDLSKEKAVPSYNVPYSQYSGYSYSHIRNFEVNGTEIRYYLFKESGSASVCTKHTGVSQKDLYDNINEIKLNYENCDLKVFDTITLTAEILADGDYEGVTLEWNTSDKTVASVTNNGVVRGNKTGTATITVSFGDFEDSCEVIVTSDVQAGYCGNNVKWEYIEESGLLIIKGSGDMYDYNANSSETPWTNLSVASVEIGSGITKVGDYSFYSEDISSVTMGKDIRIIGSHSFYGCDNLTEIKFPSKLKTIEISAFEYCDGLLEIDIPNSVTEIKSSAFSECDLIESISIPSGVINVGSNAFSGCDNLKNANISGGVQEIGSGAFGFCYSLETVSLQIGIKVIGSSAFRYCEKLTSVVLPESTIEIGECAFLGCYSLINIEIPKNVSVIGERAFSYTKKLQGFSVHSNNVNFKNDDVGVLYSKDGTKLICFPIANAITEYTIQKDVVCIENYAFDCCANLKKVTVLGDLETTGENIFSNCTDLREVSFFGCLEEIGDYAFYNCASLENFVVPDEVTTIGIGAFLNCKNMTQIILSNGLKEIEDSCFSGCSVLGEIVLPNSLEKIGADAFNRCDAITSLHIPENVVSIQSWSVTSWSGTLNLITALGIDKNVYDVYLCDYEAKDFWNEFFEVDLGINLSSSIFPTPEEVLESQVGTFNCRNLKSITVDPNNQYFSSDENGVLFNKDKTVLIRMPQNCSATEYVVPGTVISIAYSAFENCDNLQKNDLSDSVTHIGNDAFADCDNLKNITLSNLVTKIRENTFEKCISLTGVNIPESVTTICHRAFADCDTLGKVVITKNVSEIEWESFYSCDNLKYVEILGTTTGFEAFTECENLEEVFLSDNVVSISPGAFKDCSSLRKINISDVVREIGSRAFENCSALQSIVIPDSVTLLEKSAFENCDGLVAVSIGSGIVDIPERVFYDCDGLESILIPSTVTKIHATAFHKCDSLKKMAILNPSCVITRPSFFASGYLDYVRGMETKQCTLWGYSGSTAEEFAGKSGGFVANFKSFTEESHVHEYFAIGYNADEMSLNNRYHEICYCGIHYGDLISEEFNCELGGYRKTKCYYCNLEQEQDLKPTKHNLEFKSETFGTCVNPGIEVYECSACGQTEEILKSAEEGHSYTETVTAPTCTEIGYTTATCEHCGENAMYDFVPMLGHDVTVTHTDADCKKYAQTEYSCSRCDYHEIIVDEDGGLGEHKISVSVTEATCTVNGSIDQICVTCNELISSEVITANGHVSGEWKTVTEPTTETAGRKEQRCEICSELLDEEAIPKIPVNVSGVELSESKIEIINKSTHSLNAIILPDNADNKYVVWSSDNENVATVDENGVVTANALGNANITATTTDGGFTATCAVIVIPREFNVTWIVDGEKNVESFKEESTIIEPETPEKEGYSFVGWTPDIPDVMPDYDIEFTAIWLPNSYDAVFNANGGKWADGAEEKTVSTEFDSHIVVPESPEKQGYIFSGWTPEVGVMDDANGKKFSAVWIASTDTIYTVETYTMNTLGEYEKDIKTINGATDSTVNAKYEITEGFALNEEKSVLSGIVSADNSLVLKVYIDRNVYTFTTVVDGVSTATEYYYESVIADPETPVKTGYTFVGWDNNVPASMPANNVTITADFDANSYDAIFNANGGQWGDGTSSKTVSTVFDSTIIVPEEPTRNGYDFAGWDSEIGIMDDINGKEFNAKWVARNDTSYTVEIYTMDVDGEYSVEKETKQGETDSKVSVTANTQSGFTFNATNSILEGNIAADGSLVLKVFYDRNKYTLKYVVDGVETLVEYYYNASVETPAVPSKTGYTFAGWDKEIPATMPAHNLLVSAKFVCSASVSIKNNPDTKTIKYGETLRLTAITTNMPADAKIYWYVDGAKKGEGETFDVTFENGTKTVEVKLVDASDNVLKNASGNEISDSESVTVKGGFFQKIISFFKNLFGINRTIIQTVFRKR